MSKLAGIIKVLENFKFEDFRGERGIEKWNEEVRDKTRPFLEKICEEAKSDLDIEGCDYYELKRSVKKAIDSFDLLRLKIQVGGKEVKWPEVKIGFYHLEPSNAVYVGFHFWGSNEKIKRVKDIVDKTLKRKGELGQPKTFGGIYLIYRYMTLSIEDIKAKKDDEVVKDIVTQLSKIIDDIRDNEEIFEQVKDILNNVSKEEKMIFPLTEVALLVRAVNTKPFIILAGISGTGKTQLARLVAQRWTTKEKVSSAEDLFGKPNGDCYSLPEPELQPGDRKRYAFMPVRPDWNEAQKVFGFYNPLTGLFYPSDALRVVLNAYKEYVEAGKGGRNPKKHFIILDEMNLARVEYYFSDILSAIENTCKLKDGKLYLGEPFPIHFLSRCVLSEVSEPEGAYQKEMLCTKAECEGCIYMPLCKGKEGVEVSELNLEPPEGDPIPPRIAIPPNLVIIGTVNIDETTFSFSPKVLDRAFVLEFTEIEPKLLLKDEKVFNFVEKLIEILRPVNLHFGYRVMKEMEEFFRSGKEKDEIERLDFLMKSKVLTKIHGGREKVERILWQLLAYCKEGDVDMHKELPELQKEILGESGKVRTIEVDGWRYPRSARKIKQMLMMLEERGYVTYFE